VRFAFRTLEDVPFVVELRDGGPGCDASNCSHTSRVSRVEVGEVRVGRKRHLRLPVGRACPRARDRDPAPTERHLAALVPVAHRGALTIVLALRAHDVPDLLLHQLGHDAESDADRQREQPLPAGPASSPSASCTHSGSSTASVPADTDATSPTSTFFTAVPPVSSGPSTAAHAPNKSGRGGRTAVSSSTNYGTTSRPRQRPATRTPTPSSPR
jgi:hypothetical protein